MALESPGVKRERPPDSFGVTIAQDGKPEPAVNDDGGSNARRRGRREAVGGRMQREGARRGWRSSRRG
jgi:hypothetical protein